MSDFEAHVQGLLNSLQLVTQISTIDNSETILKQVFLKRRDELNNSVLKRTIYDKLVKRLNAYLKDAAWKVIVPKDWPILDKLKLTFDDDYQCPGPSVTQGHDIKGECQYKSCINWKQPNMLKNFELDHWIRRCDINTHLTDSVHHVTQNTVVDIGTCSTEHVMLYSLLIMAFDKTKWTLTRETLNKYITSHLALYKRTYESITIIDDTIKDIFIEAQSGTITKFQEFIVKGRHSKSSVNPNLNLLHDVATEQFILKYIDIDKYIDDMYGTNLVLRCKLCHQDSYSQHPPSPCSENRSLRYVRNIPISNITNLGELSHSTDSDEKYPSTAHVELDNHSLNSTQIVSTTSLETSISQITVSSNLLLTNTSSNDSSTPTIFVTTSVKYSI